MPINEEVALLSQMKFLAVGALLVSVMTLLSARGNTQRYSRITTKNRLFGMQQSESISAGWLAFASFGEAVI
jgi:hypothetical protein